MDLVAQDSGRVSFDIDIVSNPSSLQALYLGEANSFYEIKIAANTLLLNIFDNDFLYWNGTQYVGSYNFDVPITSARHNILLEWDTDGTILSIDEVPVVTTEHYITLQAGELILGREYKTTYANVKLLGPDEIERLNLPLTTSLDNIALGMHQSFPADLTYEERTLNSVLDIEGTGSFYYSEDLGETWIPISNLTAIDADDTAIFIRQELVKGDFIKSIVLRAYDTDQDRSLTDDRMLQINGRQAQWSHPLLGGRLKGVEQASGTLNSVNLNFSFKPLSPPIGLAYLVDAVDSYVRFNAGVLELGPNVDSITINGQPVASMSDILLYDVWNSIEIRFISPIADFSLLNSGGVNTFYGLVDDINDLPAPPIDELTKGISVLQISDPSGISFGEIRAEAYINAWETYG